MTTPEVESTMGFPENYLKVESKNAHEGSPVTEKERVSPFAS
jgi:hypothetical protein